MKSIKLSHLCLVITVLLVTNFVFGMSCNEIFSQLEWQKDRNYKHNEVQVIHFSEELNPAYGKLFSYSNLLLFEPKPYVYTKDIASSGESTFVVAGVNSNTTISKAKTLTGVSFETLTKRSFKPDPSKETLEERLSLYPKYMQNELNLRSSMFGFINSSTSIRSVLLKDNKTVLSKGLTHQVVAQPLLAIMKKIESYRSDLLGSTEKIIIEINSTQYEIEARVMDYAIFVNPQNVGSGWRPRDNNNSRKTGDTQGSPFNDYLFAGYSFKIKNLKTLETMTVDALTPHLIYRYGFYQGGPYRIEPIDLIRLFSL